MRPGIGTLPFMANFYPLLFVAGVFLLTAGAATVVCAALIAVRRAIRWTRRRNRA